jgi:hypothetical protein
VKLRPAQREAAEQAWAAAAGLLESGAQAAGAVLLNELHRAVHSCRVAGLHRLAQAGQRAAQQISDLQTRRPEFRLATLTQDVHQVLAVAHAIRSAADEVDQRWIGQARRGYMAVGALSILGLFTEAVTSASGYSGVVTTFVDGEGTFWSLGDVAPGDVGRCRFAYIEPFSLGEASLQHRALARGGLRLDNATAAANRRLGIGRGVTAEATDGLAWWQPPLEQLWAQPLQEQLQRVWALPAEDERHAGDDLLFVRASVCGASADSLLLRTASGVVLHGIAPMRHVELAFRENLEVLSTAVGLEVWLIARVATARSRTVQLLAVGAPSLHVPDDWRGRVNLGLDPLKRDSVPTTAAGAALAERPGEPAVDPLATLERRLEQVLLGGRSVLMLAAFARDEALLQQHQLPTAAVLLRRLRQADDLAEAWLAARIYLVAAQTKLRREQWLA